MPTQQKHPENHSETWQSGCHFWAGNQRHTDQFRNKKEVVIGKSFFL